MIIFKDTNSGFCFKQKGHRAPKKGEYILAPDGNSIIRVSHDAYSFSEIIVERIAEKVQITYENLQIERHE